MHASNATFAKPALIGALLAAAGVVASPDANAVEQVRSFYTNSGAYCHGINASNDNKLTRTAQRLRNTTNSAVTVVCNLTTDAYAVEAPAFSTVAYVTLWAYRYEDKSSNAEITCTMNTSFATDPNGEQRTRTINLPSAGTDQGQLEWYRNSMEDPGNESSFYRGPISLTCSLPPKTELHDSMLIYLVNDATTSP